MGRASLETERGSFARLARRSGNHADGWANGIRGKEGKIAIEGLGIGWTLDVDMSDRMRIVIKD